MFYVWPLLLLKGQALFSTSLFFSELLSWIKYYIFLMVISLTERRSIVYYLTLFHRIIRFRPHDGNRGITSMWEAPKISEEAVVRHNQATPRSRPQIMEDVDTCQQITYSFALIHMWNKEFLLVHHHLEITYFVTSSYWINVVVN